MGGTVVGHDSQVSYHRWPGYATREAVTIFANVMFDDGRIVWTDSQRRAIESAGHNVLVSAGAGSGKTAVLAERCAYLVCEAPESVRCRIDQLLVVTFTDAAAAEMRSRIAESLRRRIDATPSGHRAQRQLALLDGAHISTLHAFCHRLIREHFAVAEIDPAATLMDGDETALFQRETIEGWFDDLYAQPDDATADGFIRLVDDYGLGEDDRIADFILRLHAFVQSLVDPNEWLRQAVNCWSDSRRDPDRIAAIRAEQHCGDLEAFLDQAASLGRWISTHAPRWSGYVDGLDIIRRDVEDWVATLSSAPESVEDLATAMGQYSFPPPPRRSKKDSASDIETKQQTQKQWATLRKQFADITTSFKFTLAELCDGLAKIESYIHTIVRLVEQFGELYAGRKRDEGLLDFNDLERLALRILSDGENPKSASRLARQLRNQFAHVLVDEFQDINPIQATILSRVSRDDDSSTSGNLFVVGDIKQSIYRFRLAEPKVFANLLSVYGDSTNRSGELIHLRENFRSRASVLSAVNAVFERLLSREFADLAYDDAVRLIHPDPARDPLTEPAVECHVLEARRKSDRESENDDSDPQVESAVDISELESIEREALFIGRRIREITGREGSDAAMCIEGRELTFRDIVVLLRAPRHKAGRLARMLERMGVPAFADVGTGYFEELEVRDVLNLLRVLDNRRQDIPLAAVLRSPVLMEPLRDAELAEICTVDRRVPFHEAVMLYARRGCENSLRQRLREALDALDVYRTAASRQPLADVIWRILEETGYFAYVSGLPGGAMRRANLLRLHQRARQFGRFAHQGLHRFLRFLEQLQEQDHDIGTAPTVSETDDVVRILSVHKSKGLEFPVVFFADLNKRWNLDDTRGDLMFERDEYIGLRVVDPERGIKYPSLASERVSAAIRRETLKEEMRLLYVAFTRARERLILVGSDEPRAMQTIRANMGPVEGPIRPTALRSARSALSWVLQALAVQPEGRVAWPDETQSTTTLFTVGFHPSATIDTLWHTLDQTKHTAAEALRPFAMLGPLPSNEPIRDVDPVTDAVTARIATSYSSAAMTSVPAVVAASEMKRRFDLLSEAGERQKSIVETSAQWERPRFLDKAGGDELVATERGTATHRVLEHLDWAGEIGVDSIRRQIDRFVASGVLARGEGDAVSADAIAWFLDTPLGRRLRAEPDAVQREVMFVARVSPDHYDAGLCATDANDVILVRGIIDCLLRTDEGVEIIDYKTDAISREQVADRAGQYARQLSMYAHAVTTIWRQPVRGRHLVFLGPRVIHSLG